jgi:hypothetical protein
MSRPALGIPLAISRLKVSPKRFQCDTLNIDLTRSPKSKSTENWHWWTPSLNSMLKEKGADDQRHREPPSVDGGSKCRACKSESRGVCFQQTLNIPFLIEPP